MKYSLWGKEKRCSKWVGRRKNDALNGWGGHIVLVLVCLHQKRHLNNYLHRLGIRLSTQFLGEFCEMLTALAHRGIAVVSVYTRNNCRRPIYHILGQLYSSVLVGGCAFKCCRVNGVDFFSVSIVSSFKFITGYVILNSNLIAFLTTIQWRKNMRNPLNAQNISNSNMTLTFCPLIL